MPSMIKDTFDLRAPSRHTVTASLPNDSGVKIASTVLVGIEVEVENITTLGDMNSAWSHKTDGSLRNHGAEFVTRPIAACDAPAALQHLLRTTLPPTASFSPRTSVHVHMDFTHDRMATVEDVILLYSVFERLFYKFVRRQRIKNIYCVPITETNLLREWGRRGSLHPDRWEKYTGLNARCLSQFGTIEFRHMHGTFDVAKLAIWIDLITKLKEFCVKQGTKQIRSLIASMDDGFDFKKLLVDIFAESESYLKFESFSDVALTYSAAKTVLCGNKAHVELQSAFSRESALFNLRNL